MKNLKSTSRKEKITESTHVIKKTHICVMAAVFALLISAVSAVALNAFAIGADQLPAGYENVNISGIYYCNLGSSESKNVSQIRILDYVYEEIEGRTNSQYVQYPSGYEVTYIEAVDSNGTTIAYSASLNSFSLDLSQLGKISTVDGVDILSYLYQSTSRVYMNGKGAYSGKSYYDESGFSGLNVNFVLTLSDGNKVNVTSLNCKNFYYELLSELGDEDTATYYVLDTELIKTFDLNQSTAIDNTAFLHNVTIPLKNSNGSYLAPNFQFVYSDGTESMVVENRYDDTLSPSSESYIWFNLDGAAAYTPGDIFKKNLHIQYGAYGYRTVLPTRIELKYKLEMGVTDANDPKLEDDSGADPIDGSKYIFNRLSGFTTNDGSNLSKGGNILDKWVMVDNNGDPITDDNGNYISEALPGDTLYINKLSDDGNNYTPLDAYTYEGVDPDTGEFIYSYTASPVWRNTAKLKYDLNLSQVTECVDAADSSKRYSITGGESSWYLAPTFYDANNYTLNTNATIISNTYTATNYTFIGWTEDKVLPILKQTDDGNYIDADYKVYSASSILKGGNEVLMDEDHTLYAVWRTTNPDNFVKVTVTIKNGKFIFADDPENPVNSGCDKNNTSNYCKIYTSTWVNPTGTTSAFISKTSELNFLSIPDEGYESFKLRYSIGADNISSQGYGENELPSKNNDKDGRCNHFLNSPLSDASSDKTYYYEIEYVDASVFEVYFYDNNPNNPLNTSGTLYTNGSVKYSVYGLWRDTEYNLSQWSTPQKDGSVKLREVGIRSTDYTTWAEKWTPAPDAKFGFEGYYFVGWAKLNYTGSYYNYDANNLIDTIEFTDVTRIDLAAVWKEIPKVIYYSDTDKATAIDTQSKTPGFEITVGLSDDIAEPTKEHYTFNGWQCVTDGVTVTDGKFKMPDGIVEFVPVWEINKNDVIYKVTNAPTGYTAPETQSVEYGEEVTVAAVPNITGYNFAGWNCTTSGVAVTNGKFTMPDNAVTFTGTFIPESFNLKYYNNIDNSSPIATQSKEYNAKVSVADGVTAPTRDGYTLSGWNTYANGGGTSYTTGEEFTMPANDVDLYAQWTESVYQLVYDKNTTDTVKNMPADVTNLTYNVVLNGYDLDIITVPTRKGYTFAGWTVGSVENASKAQYADFNNSECKAVAIAQWRENTYTIVYNENSPTGSDASVSDMPENASVTYTNLLTGYPLSGSPKCDDYTFKGWSKTPNGTVVDKVDATDLPNSGTVINVYAVWGDPDVSPEMVDIVYRSGFTSDNPNDVWQGEYTFPADISEPYKILDNKWFSREGYSFNGWIITNEDGSTQNIMTRLARAVGLSNVGTVVQAGDSVTLSGPLYLAANWEAIEYHVTYDANGATGGTVPKDENSYKKGDDVTVLDKGNLSCGEYKFKEWNTDPKGKGTAYKADDVFDMPASNVTLYAIWVNSEGNIVSPGTGEGIVGMYIALTLMIISVITIHTVIIKRRKSSMV